MNEDDKALRRAEVRAGREAQRLVEDSLLRGAFEALREECLGTMCNVRANDEAVLEAKRQLHTLEAVERYLSKVLTTGKMANQQLEEARQ